MSRLIAVVTTVETRAQAQALARRLVERRLAACAQISEIESVYVWDGAVQQGAEFRVLFKVPAGGYAAVEAAILEGHPYELPAVHAYAIEAVYGPYAEWVEREVRG